MLQSSAGADRRVAGGTAPAVSSKAGSRASCLASHHATALDRRRPHLLLYRRPSGLARSTVGAEPSPGSGGEGRCLRPGAENIGRRVRLDARRQRSGACEAFRSDLPGRIPPTNRQSRPYRSPRPGAHSTRLSSPLSILRSLAGPATWPLFTEIRRLLPMDDSLRDRPCRIVVLHPPRGEASPMADPCRC